MAASGVVAVDKPQGWTSHQVVGRCRRLLGTRKVGHAGTLDPMATGLLLVGVERATRLLGFLAGHDKTYTATIRLGQATVTDDAEGDVTAAPGATGLGAATIEAAMAALRGDIVQVPSAVSAIKVDGRRAYALVRAGAEVSLKARPVSVTRFTLEDRRETTVAGVPVIDLDVVVDCSSGTYVRALARDLGSSLGVGGHLTALRRTRIGGFTLADVTLDAAGLAGEEAPSVMGSGQVARRAFPWVEVDARVAQEVRFGRALDLKVPGDPTALLWGEELLALYRPLPDGGAAPAAVFV